MIQESADRMVWIDGLRLIAGVSMVGLHASSDVNGQPFPDFSLWERTGPVMFRSVMYLARTELFIIIALFLLFLSLDNRPRNYTAVITKQSKRLMRPFLFWVAFYAFYRLIKAHFFGYKDAIWAQLANPVDWVGFVLLGDVQYHMHFLPTLFCLVLLYPIYWIAVEKPWIGVLVLLCLFTKREVDIWLWAHSDVVPGIDYLIRFVKIITYVGYGFVAAAGLGIYKNINVRNGLAPYFNMILFTGIILYLLKLIYSMRVIQSGNWQFNYAPGFWADFLMPVVLFFLFMSSQRLSGFYWLSRLAPYSFGIYLVHPAFLDLAEIALWDSTLSPIVFVLSKVTWAILMSSITVVVLSKIPGLGWTIGLGIFPNISQISRFIQPKITKRSNR